MTGDLFNGWPEDGEPMSEVRTYSVKEVDAAYERIEQLEAALRKVFHVECFHDCDHCGCIVEAQDIARAALKEQT